MEQSRRELLKAAAGVTTTGSFAGCTERLDNVASTRSGREGGFASFFTLFDLARNVGRSEFEVKNPVPAGTMGHRWEPSSDLPPEIASHQAFVYLGIDGFQRWALDTAELIERDHPDVVLIDALDGIDLRRYDQEDEGEHVSDDDDSVHDQDDHDDDENHDGDDHNDGDDHSDGDFDPHYWLDPVKAAESVVTIANGLAEADPDNADAYEDNASAYVDKLHELKAEFDGELENRQHDTVVVAAHDSYQYLAERFGFEIHSPVGVSPHAEPSQDEIADTIELIDEEEIDVVLADFFESDALAETIVRESNATRIEQLSPVEGTIERWNDRNWGYVEQMSAINLPTLKAALGTSD